MSDDAESRESILAEASALLNWTGPAEFLTACLNAKEIRQLLDDKAGVDELLEAMDTVFDEKYLVALATRFDQVRQRVAEWLLSRSKEVRKAFLPTGRITWKRGDARKRYCWLCQDCGERKGSHYFPVNWCRTCRGNNIIRQATKSPLGYSYRDQSNRSPQ